MHHPASPVNHGSMNSKTIDPQGQRNISLDVFRAIALLTIFINHTSYTAYGRFTHKNFGFTDSTEVFVLISGIAVGLAYGSKFHNINNRIFLLLKLWKRASILYCAHILTTIFTLALFCGSALLTHHADILTMFNVSYSLTEPVKAFVGIVTLGYQLNFNDILPLYAILMLTAPLIFFLASQNLTLLFCISAILYLVSGIYSIAPANYPNEGVWFLNPLSWQFLFIIGIIATYSMRRGNALPSHPILLFFAILYLILSCIWVTGNLWWISDWLHSHATFPRFFTDFNKTYLSLPRLLHILALAYIVTRIPFLFHWTQTRIARPLAILGKYPLPVFITGTLLAIFVNILKQLIAINLVADGMILVTGVIIQFTIAYFLEWLHGINRQNTIIKPSLSPGQAIFSPEIFIQQDQNKGKLAFIFQNNKKNNKLPVTPSNHSTN